MKKFKVMLSVFMVLLILSVSISPAFAESEYSFETAVKQEESCSSEEYEIVTDELSEGPYNNDEKIFCTATIEDDFDDDSLLVVMKNKASLDLENYSPLQFAEIDAKKVNELTTHKTKEIRSEFESKKAELTTALKNAVSSNNNVSRSVLSTAPGSTLTAVDNKVIEENATALSVAEIEREYNDFHKIIHVVLDTKDKQNVLDTIKELEKNEDVLAAEPNYTRIQQATVANDTNLSQQWALENISAPSAWNITTGSSSVKVGIIDDGIDSNHPDLANNYDHNLSKGFGDDPAPEDSSLNGHGTAVAGVIGAVGNNNKGITGICWNVKLVSLQQYSSDGDWELSNLIDAINYADEKGIPILNHSYTIDPNGGSMSSLEVAINSYDGIFITSAGNDIANIDAKKPSTDYLYPSRFPSKKIISVAAIDENNILWVNADDNTEGSNYGVKSVDLAAPGGSIKTTANGTYENWSGTSLAAPYVAGVAALIKSEHPQISYLGIRKAILDGVDKKTTLSEKVSTGGKLNAYKALNNVRKIKYTIEYDANGGTGAMADTQITFGFYTNLRNITFTRKGYYFSGWYVYRERDNKYYYTNGSTKKWFEEDTQPTGYNKVVYADQTPIGHLSETNGDVITMIANWNPINYRVNFDKNGGGGSVNTLSCKYDTTYTLPTDNISRSGYILHKWLAYKYDANNTMLWLYSDGINYIWSSEAIESNQYLVSFEHGGTIKNLTDIKDDLLYLVAQWLLRGDVDLDGEISIMDSTLIQKYFVQMVTFTEEQIICGDFNEDGVFDITDATAIQQYLISGSQ